LGEKARMTASEVRSGIRKLLSGQGGDEIDASWFERAGEEGKTALLAAFRRPSTTSKIRFLVMTLLVAFYLSERVEEELRRFYARHQNERARRQDIRALEAVIASRQKIRQSIFRVKRPNQSLEPTSPSVTDRADARSAPAAAVAHL
jgi:hypothetical protein